MAAKEIKQRSPYSKLWVSTIHDFLWDTIKGFQKNLAEAVVTLIKNEIISYSGETEIEQLSLATIEYKNYRKLEEGIISHDDVLKVAEHMFKNHPLLTKILCDKYEYIFIDEYQDTQKAVANIFLEHIRDKAAGKLCVGFFGDKMQSIYETGIVDIQSYVDNGQVLEIKKTDNYRCSKSVIALLNKLRTDLSQKTAKINENGEVVNKNGSALFLYSNSDFDLSVIAESKYIAEWDLLNPADTKLLFLTHRLIAGRDGWDGLLSAYRNNDMLLGDEPDKLAKLLLKLGGIIYYYQQKKYDKVVEILQRKIKNIGDKKAVSRFLKDTCDNLNQPISKTLDLFEENRLLRKDDKFDEYLQNHEERWSAIKDLPISQVLAYYSYYNEHSPYSTQHGIKGAEFNNVLVVMDNGKWNNYNFKSYFEGSGKETVIERTGRIVYVCCSRAIDNLVVYYPSPSANGLAKAKDLFGEENVVSL